MELTREEYALLNRIMNEDGLFLDDFDEGDNIGRVRRLESIGYVRLIGDYVAGITPDGIHAIDQWGESLRQRRIQRRRWIITTTISVIALLKSFLPELSAAAAWLWNILAR